MAGLADEEEQVYKESLESKAHRDQGYVFQPMNADKHILCLVVMFTILHTSHY